MTTGFLEKAFKGISDYYGDDCNVDVQYSLTKIYDFTVVENSPDLHALADLDLKFWVETKNGTVDLAADLAVE